MSQFVKAEPEVTTDEPVADTSVASVEPPADPLNPVATVTEKLLVLKCTNPMEAVAHEKHLCNITETALKGSRRASMLSPVTSNWQMCTLI